MSANLQKSRLNNLKLGFHRRTVEYEAIFVDLYLAGVVPKEVVEAFTGRQVPDYLSAPKEVEQIKNKDKPNVEGDKKDGGKSNGRGKQTGSKQGNDSTEGKNKQEVEKHDSETGDKDESVASEHVADAQ